MSTFDAAENVAEYFQRITRHTTNLSLALLLKFPQRRDGFIHHLIQIAVFVVVRLDDIDVFNAHAAKLSSMLAVTRFAEKSKSSSP